MIEEVGNLALQNITAIGVLVAWVGSNLYDKRVTMNQFKIAIDNNTMATLRLQEALIELRGQMNGKEHK